jgi:purine-nucleoside phosphorylase
MNDQGPDVTNFTRAFLQHIDVKYIITVGVCGGEERYLKKVMLFDKAWIMSEVPPKLTHPTSARYGDVELWRQFGSIFDIVKPENAHVILTHSTIVGKVPDVLAEFNQKVLPAL